MWAETCGSCEGRQLFGFRYLTALENVRDGVMRIGWRCPQCGAPNAIETGSAVPLDRAVA